MRQPFFIPISFCQSNRKLHILQDLTPIPHPQTVLVEYNPSLFMRFINLRDFYSCALSLIFIICN